MIKLIAAIGINNELGKDNNLIWYFKEDMKYFKETTLNHTVVMGRKTYESIGAPLPNRKNIVITSRDIDGVITVDNPSKILDIKEDIFIIGGESIYKYFIDYADELYLTEIDRYDNDADAFFPIFNKDLYTREVLNTISNNDMNFSFVKYIKIKR